MARLNWDNARRLEWTENVHTPEDDLLGYAILGSCLEGTCTNGRYLVPINKVVSILVAGMGMKTRRRKGRRGEEWDEAREEALRREKVRNLLVDYCPFTVTYNAAEGCLVRPEVWRRGGGVGDPHSLRRIEVQVVGDELELVPVPVT